MKLRQSNYLSIDEIKQIMITLYKIGEVELANQILDLISTNKHIRTYGEYLMNFKGVNIQRLIMLSTNYDLLI